MTEISLQDKTTFGEAVFRGFAEDNSPEWHELRLAGLGGSDIAAVCKVSPWGSPWSVWARKTGNLSDDSGESEAMEWGKLLEPVIVGKFERKHPELSVRTKVGSWAHRDRPWQLANPDGIYELPDGSHGILEVKTARYEDDWANGVPAYYRTQVLWYLQTFGLRHAYVAVLFGGNKYREFEVEYDEFEAAANLAEAAKIWELIQTGEQPDFDGMFTTYETIRALNPAIDPEGQIELGDLYIHYANAVADYNKAESTLNEMKSRILDAMGTAKRGIYDDKWVLTRQSKQGGNPYLIAKKN